MNDLINAVGEKTALLDAAIRQLGKRGQAYAEAESNYRMALSKAILEERANGTPVTIISDICKGKSDIAKLRFQRDCAEVVYKSAMEAINSYKLQIRIRRIRQSGLGDLLNEYTFDKFQTESPWQEAVKNSALKFLEDHDRKWFFIGGQVGAGKTHLCTAIVGEFLNRGISAKYMLWRDEALKLKAVVNDDAAYSNLIKPLKTVPVLYIDDFFRTGNDETGRKKAPTQGDINVAFELINYRYNNNLVTILSSELTVDQILFFDEAVGSRIYQRTKEYHWDIAKDPHKNYRLK